MTIAIEKGIPFPQSKTRGPRAKYPFADMEVGDSFPADVKDGKQVSKRSFQGSAYSAAKRLGWRFTVGEDSHGVLRCWRLPDGKAGEAVEGNATAH